MSRAERAKQFMPFAALHGFEDAIHQKEFITAKKRELSEEESEKLNSVIISLNKGDLVEVEYYFVDRYVKIKGTITEINFEMRYIRIIKTEIKFSDLYSVQEII